MSEVRLKQILEEAKAEVSRWPDWMKREIDRPQPPVLRVRADAIQIASIDVDVHRQTVQQVIDELAERVHGKVLVRLEQPHGVKSRYIGAALVIEHFDLARGISTTRVAVGYTDPPPAPITAEGWVGAA